MPSKTIRTIVHIFARPWPPKEGVARYVETISIAEKVILGNNVKIILISLWDYTNFVLEKYKDFIVIKIPRIRRFLARSETIYSLLQVKQLKNILKILNVQNSTFFHIHMPVYVNPEQETPFGITFHGYNPPTIFRMYDALVPHYIIRKLCKYSKFNTAVGLATTILLREKLGINVKPVLTPVPYDVLAYTLKYKIKARKNMIVINAKDPLKVFDILQALIHSNIITKHRLNILVFGLKTTYLKRFIKRINKQIFKSVQRYTRIRVLGYLRHEKLLRLLSSAMLFIYTSRREGMPTLVVEALALGTPTIVPRVVGCIDLAKMHVVVIVDQILKMYKDYVHVFSSIKERVLKVHHPEVIAKYFANLYGLI